MSRHVHLIAREIVVGLLALAGLGIGAIIGQDAFRWTESQAVKAGQGQEVFQSSGVAVALGPVVDGSVAMTLQKGASDVRCQSNRIGSESGSDWCEITHLGTTYVAKAVNPAASGASSVQISVSQVSLLSLSQVVLMVWVLLCLLACYWVLRGAGQRAEEERTQQSR